MQLTNDLTDTASELADVFGRLQSSLQLTAGDRAAMKGICDLAGSKLGKLQASLVSAAQAQGGMLQDMQAQVGAMIQLLLLEPSYSKCLHACTPMNDSSYKYSYKHNMLQQ